MLAALLIAPVLWTGIANVNIQNFSFVPDTVRIQPGDTVRWTQKDASQHTSSGTGTGAGDWSSGALSQNQVYTRAFPAAGTYPYICDFHAMFGTVVVGTPTSLRPSVVPGSPASEVASAPARDVRGKAVNGGAKPGNASNEKGAPRKSSPTFTPR